jgi:hypothetical protein
LAVAGGLSDMLQMIKTSIVGGKKVKFGGGTACEKRENLDIKASLLMDNKIKPAVDKVFLFMNWLMPILMLSLAGKRVT